MEYWKFKAIDRLRNYRAQVAAIENLRDEMACLEYKSHSINSATADSSPVRGGGNSREDMLLSNIVQREEYSQMHERATRSVAAIERAMSVLNAEELHLLDVMYINHQKNAVERLMEEYSLMETSSVYKRINKALLHFTVAMYGGTEN